ncbi:radical SAM protein [Actinocrispum wychmicini]|uniref:radical SAM protein n=1 Tax=Actinocrispum wychmicini TaxID=1213861 RepID=UPI001A9E26C4|nr:radical SAM protein [Actinocrispum wychmicini]
MLNIREFEAGATQLRSMPRVLFLELTENCNLSCPMCRAAGPYDRSKNMSQEIFDRVVADLFPAAEIVDLRGWGESTILKTFPQAVDRTIEAGCRIRLVTNLTVPNEALWRRLVRHHALILVSFDAARADTFATLRRGAKLAVVLRNLEVMVDEARRSGVPVDTIRLNVVVQPQAIPELPDIVRIAADLGLSHIQLNPLTVAEESPDHLSRHRPPLARALRDATQVAAERGVTIQLDAALDESWADQTHAAKRCTHPWMYCYINYRGQVGFCDHLIGSPASGYLLGDLTTTSFQDIWNGAAYQRLRAEHVHWEQQLSARFEECNWCYRNRYVDVDDRTYPPYGEHVVRLTTATCPAVGAHDVPASAPQGRRLLPMLPLDRRTKRLGGTSAG